MSEGMITLPAMSANATLRFAFLSLLTALLVTACGGDDGGDTVEISMTEFTFTESTWTVKAEEEFTFVLDNDGSVIHNWSIVVPGKEIRTEGDLPDDPAERGDLYLHQEELEAGTSVTRRFIAPPAGTYQVICDIQAHFSAGMVGTLTVEP